MAQSSKVIDKCVNVQLMPFIAIVFAGVILIFTPSQAPSLLMILPALLGYGRRSAWSVRRSQSWTVPSPATGATA
ncbi:hypothetical protein [Streptomyces sp. CB00455]|uniref:hypothetical protein n=1 Tax=Streptomyces sp. CB00455 TaxID=1703927 RepID=UPI0013013AEC|nr:hypothetical protein [Streptomyces sp. CB00455]